MLPIYPPEKYQQCRPTYPPELYQEIYNFHRLNRDAEFKLAVDVGTGTGQVANALETDFEKVKAFDISADMLQVAKKTKVEYQVSPAESFAKFVEPASVDLITAGTCAHWFDMPAFYAECQKALKPSGTVAVFAYGHLVFSSSPQATTLHSKYAMETLEKYWPNGREKIDLLYSWPEFTDSPFPIFDRRLYPSTDTQIIMHQEWSFAEIKGYLESWSAYRNWKEVHPQEPDLVDIHVKELMKVLGFDDVNAKIPIYWPVVLLLGKKQL
jgi:SAM-dependent methyltransferase